MSAINTVFDVETIGLPEDEIRALIGPFRPEKVALGNAKKADTVERIIEDARMVHGNDIVANAALDPRYGRVAIAGRLFVSDGHEAAAQLDSPSESLLLKSLWRGMESEWCANPESHTVGFNVFWDLRFCVRRSWVHGIKVPESIYNPRNGRYPFRREIIDLQSVLAMGEYGKGFESLDDALRSFGLPPKTGHGRDFPALWARDKKAGLEYNLNDLRCEHALAQRLGVL
jgi:hypothetical protein